MKELLVSALAALACGLTAAAPPTAVSISPGFSFAEYAGAQPVGVGAVNAPFSLFYIDEKTIGAIKSWYLFLDPGPLSQDLLATIRFDAPISAVLTTRAELDASNAAYASDAVSYGSSRFMGLENCALERRYCDAVAWTPGGSELSLDWSAVHPGDHIRVIVEVPEPANPLLFAVGLAGIALMLRRKRR